MMKLLTQSKLKRKVLDNRSNTSVLPEKFWGLPRKEYDHQRKNLGDIKESSGNEPECVVEVNTTNAGQAHPFNMGSWRDSVRSDKAKAVRKMKRIKSLERITDY